MPTDYQTERGIDSDIGSIGVWAVQKSDQAPISVFPPQNDMAARLMRPEDDRSGAKPEREGVARTSKTSHPPARVATP